MGAMSAARRVKHLAFVARKRARRGLRKVKFDAATIAFRDVEKVRAFTYRPARYGDTFLTRTLVVNEPSELPPRAFVVWTGDNPLTENRARNLEVIRSRIGLPVELVTPSTIGDWLVGGEPLHPAYEHLSLIHRSDYLRGYLMHHHGGAYLDIKAPLQSWAGSYEDMRSDPDAWAMSFSASHANWPAKLRGRIGRDIIVRYRMIFGNSGFMMRSHTSLTAEWMAEMDRRLDDAQEELARHPGGVYGEGPGYPLSWNDLLARVLDPLNLKYLRHVRFDERMMLDLQNYR